MPSVPNLGAHPLEQRRRVLEIESSPSTDVDRAVVPYLRNCTGYKEAGVEGTVEEMAEKEGEAGAVGDSLRTHPC